MAYTKQQLDMMSNKEINIALAKMLMDRQGAPYSINENPRLSKLDKFRQDSLGKQLHPDSIDVICGFAIRVDYCNNWNDIMPLAIECGISLFTLNGSWQAVSGKSKGISEDFQYKSPQRAIACHLLMMELNQ